MLIRLKQVKHYQNNYPKQLHTSFFSKLCQEIYICSNSTQAGRKLHNDSDKNQGKKIIVSDKLLPQPSLNNNQKY